MLEERAAWPRILAKWNGEVMANVPVVATALEAQCSDDTMAKSGVVASAWSWRWHGAEKERNRVMDWAFGGSHKGKGGAGTMVACTVEATTASGGAMGDYGGD